MVLQNNAGDNLTVSANGSFTFATLVPSGGAYAVTALSNATRVCTPSSATGTVVAANVTNVVVRCRTKYAYFSNEGGSTRAVSSYTIGANGGFTVASSVPVSTNTLIPVAPSATRCCCDSFRRPRDRGERCGQLAGPGWRAAGLQRERQQRSADLCLGDADGSARLRQHLLRRLNSGDISCGIGVNSAPETVVIHPNGRFVYVMDGVAAVPATTLRRPATLQRAGNRCDRPLRLRSCNRDADLPGSPLCRGLRLDGHRPAGPLPVGEPVFSRGRSTRSAIDQSTGALTFSGGTFIGMTNGEMFFGSIRTATSATSLTSLTRRSMRTRSTRPRDA